MPPLSNNGRPPLYPGSPNSVRLDNSSSSSTDFLEPVAKQSITPRSEQCVSFFSRTQVFEVPNCTDYTPEECHRIWYSAHDLDTFTREAVDAARRIGRRTPKYTDVARGLENKTPQGFQETNLRRMRALMAVLSEQRRQFDMCMEDDLLIAQQYFDLSEESVMQALDRAAVDALEAELYQREDSSERDLEDDSDLLACCVFAPLAWLKIGKSKPALESL